ncbi:PTS sugar transporter subunit IIA [Lactobacillus sp. ESL0791]|uniref:PTS sugar transporter subunit IIA n=1 Tax=Lactobacillus sp. ESL0791 TaxID=2983234 RepID=UPI0023F6D1FE|nr:PTS sugar transporter subunit IIA [Lactobacillus sp. ESL0791]MDF7637901.1 PTS sugar transporter subunit IIA [Lactobacillus sp. ESL0791]
MTRKIFLVSHGNFAKGMKSSIEMIAGKFDNLFSFGLQPGGNPNELVNQVVSNFDDSDEVIILGDLKGGSVCNAMLALSLRKNVTLITGTNLALALETVLRSNNDELDEDIIKAKDNIEKLEIKPQKNNEEDFFS